MSVASTVAAMPGISVVPMMIGASSVARKALARCVTISRVIGGPMTLILGRA